MAVPPFHFDPQTPNAANRAGVAGRLPPFFAPERGLRGAAPPEAAAVR